MPSWTRVSHLSAHHSITPLLQIPHYYTYFCTVLKLDSFQQPKPSARHIALSAAQPPHFVPPLSHFGPAFVPLVFSVNTGLSRCPACFHLYVRARARTRFLLTLTKFPCPTMSHNSNSKCKHCDQCSFILGASFCALWRRSVSEGRASAQINSRKAATQSCETSDCFQPKTTASQPELTAKNL